MAWVPAAVSDRTARHRFGKQKIYLTPIFSREFLRTLASRLFLSFSLGGIRQSTATQPHVEAVVVAYKELKNEEI